MTDFSSYASQWHEKTGPLWSLHQLHTLRCQFMQTHQVISGHNCIDLACGGGLMTEELKRQQATSVTGLDISDELITLARQRSNEKGLSIDYRIQDLRQSWPHFEADIICAFEIIEHLSEPIESFIAKCDQIASEKCYLYISSLNKTQLAKILAIWLTEEVLGWLDPGTHDFDSFIPLDELINKLSPQWELIDLEGVTWSIKQQRFVSSASTDIHYLCCFRRKQNGSAFSH